MTNFDQAAAVTLFPSMAAAFGQTITFHRGSENVSLTGIKTDPTMIESDATEIYVAAEANDFLFLASDLLISDVEIKPANNDYIMIGAVKYEILSTGQGFYRYEDPAETIIRVQTKRII